MFWAESEQKLSFQHNMNQDLLAVCSNTRLIRLYRLSVRIQLIFHLDYRYQNCPRYKKLLIGKPSKIQCFADSDWGLYWGLGLMSLSFNFGQDWLRNANFFKEGPWFWCCGLWSYRLIRIPTLVSTSTLTLTRVWQQFHSLLPKST